MQLSLRLQFMVFLNKHQLRQKDQNLKVKWDLKEFLSLHLKTTWIFSRPLHMDTVLVDFITLLLQTTKGYWILKNPQTEQPPFHQELQDVLWVMQTTSSLSNIEARDLRSYPKLNLLERLQINLMKKKMILKLLFKV